MESKRRIDRLKDRGDMQRRNLPEKEILKQPPDRGDLNKPVKDKKSSPQKKLEKEVSLQKKSEKEVSLQKKSEKEVSLQKKSEKEVSLQKKSENEVTTQSNNPVKPTRKVEKPEVEFRQRVRDRYTLKPKGMMKFQSRKDQLSYVRDELSQKQYFCKDSKDSEPAEKGKTSPETKSERSSKLRKPARRKAPVTKHTPIIPKVVTFMQRNARPQLRAPELLKELITPRRIAKRLPTMPDNKRLKTTRDRAELDIPQSPSTISQAAIISPPTEVAKWTSPSSIHTMPYYEAWVDTTLAAISKISNKDKLYEKQRMLQSFHSQLQRFPSPELVFKNTDERCVGTIRVRQR